MAYAHVQTVVGNGALRTVTSTTAGNLGVLFAFWSGGAGSGPVVTSGFVAVSTEVVDASNFVTQAWYYENMSAGITSIGITSWGAATPGSIRTRVSEYSGIATSSSLINFNKQTQVSPGNGTDAVTSGTTNATNTVPALIWGGADCPGLGNALTQGTGFTSRGTDDGGRIEDRRETSTGNYASLFTAAGSPARTHAWMMAFAETGGAPAINPDVRNYGPKGFFSTLITM